VSTHTSGLSKSTRRAPAKPPATALEGRRDLIRQIEAARGTQLVCYVTSTRPGLEVAMAQDVIRQIYPHLEKIKASARHGLPKLDLFIYSNGGDTTVPWRLVSLLREYTLELSVLVPFRAFSAATLTALGANKIVMHPMGTLGPTDPTVNGPFNPRDPVTQRNIGVSVEDVTAYLQLVKEDAGITHEDELVQTFNLLAEQVHPLALGNVKRILSQSRSLATKLLSMHMNKTSDGHKIQDIVESLTSKLFYHGHPISRVEARDQIGLESVDFATEEVAALMWELYLRYETELELLTPFNSAQDFMVANPSFATQPAGTSLTTPTKVAKLAYVESAAASVVSVLEYELMGVRTPDMKTAVSLLQKRTGWQDEV